MLSCAAKIEVYVENKMNNFHVIQHNSSKNTCFTNNIQPNTAIQ
jgi:hypothetical protein